MSTSIHSYKSFAIRLANQLIEEYDQKSGWLKDCEQQIDIARRGYDTENNNLDNSQAPYPPLNELANRYLCWQKKIDGFLQNIVEINQLRETLLPEVRRLEWIQIPDDTFSQIDYLNKDLCQDLRLYYDELEQKLTIIKKNLKRIEDLKEKIFKETNWIKEHPHQRLHQIIERVTCGQVTPTARAYYTDKAFRHVYSLTSYLIGPSSSTPAALPMFEPSLSHSSSSAPIPIPSSSSSLSSSPTSNLPLNASPLSRDLPS